jgi:hypothetical protein
MSDHFSELESVWQSGKENIQSSPESLQTIYAQIQQNKRSNFLFYYGTIIILSITFIAVASFFYFVAPVQETLSRIGVGLMLGGLFIRIILEVVTGIRSKKVHVQRNSLEAVNHAIAFYKFRKKVQFLVAPTIVVLYTIGFYIITPEFLEYLSTESVIFFDVLYLFLAIFLFVQIRRGVIKEIRTLNETIQLKKEILEAGQD